MLAVTGAMGRYFRLMRSVFAALPGIALPHGPDAERITRAWMVNNSRGLLQRQPASWESCGEWMGRIVLPRRKRCDAWQERTANPSRFAAETCGEGRPNQFRPRNPPPPAPSRTRPAPRERCPKHRGPPKPQNTQ